MSQKLWAITAALFLAVTLSACENAELAQERNARVAAEKVAAVEQERRNRANALADAFAQGRAFVGQGKLRSIDQCASALADERLVSLPAFRLYRTEVSERFGAGCRQKIRQDAKARVFAKKKADEKRHVANAKKR